MLKKSYYYLKSFKSPSHSRTLVLLAFLVMLISVPMVVFISGQRQEVRQRASSSCNGTCSDIYSACRNACNGDTSCQDYCVQSEQDCNASCSDHDACYTTDGYGLTRSYPQCGGNIIKSCDNNTQRTVDGTHQLLVKQYSYAWGGEEKYISYDLGEAPQCHPNPPTSTPTVTPMATPVPTATVTPTHPAGGTTATCEGSWVGAGYSCSPNKLIVSWNVSNPNQTVCNIYIRAGNDDYRINSSPTECTVSNKTITGTLHDYSNVKPDIPIVNNGTYQLRVSNGLTGCDNENKGNITLSTCGSNNPTATPTVTPTTGACSAQSIQARFQKNSTDPWDSSKTITQGETAYAAVFKNESISFAGSGTSASITGPGTNQSLNTSQTNSFTPSQAGTYTLAASCGSRANTATLTVQSGGNPTATPTTSAVTTPTPTGTNPTATTGPTASPTTNPNSPKLNLALNLQAVGQNRTSENLKHPDRNITLCLYAPNADPAGDKECTKALYRVNGTVSYDTDTGLFKNTAFDLGDSVAGGNYQVLIKAKRYLRKKVLKTIAVSPRQTTPVPSTTLIVGDINEDNEINASDYAAYYDCWGQRANTSSCLYKENADLADLGHTDTAEDMTSFRWLFASFQTQTGD